MRCQRKKDLKWLSRDLLEEEGALFFREHDDLSRHLISCKYGGGGVGDIFCKRLKEKVYVSGQQP